MIFLGTRHFEWRIKDEDHCTNNNTEMRYRTATPLLHFKCCREKKLHRILLPQAVSEMEANYNLNEYAFNFDNNSSKDLPWDNCMYVELAICAYPSIHASADVESQNEEEKEHYP